MQRAIVMLNDLEHGPMTLLANPNVTAEQAQALVLAMQPFFPGAVIRLKGERVDRRISAFDDAQ